MADTAAKRETLKALLNQQRQAALSDGSSTMANLFYGYIVRVDAGRCDERLDHLIAQARMELGQ